MTVRAQTTPRPTGSWLWAVLCFLPLFGHAAAPKEHIVVRIDGVTGDVEANVRSYLTLSRYATRDDLTDPQVRRLADRAVDEAADALRPFGFYSPKIRSRTSRDEPNWIVRLIIDPGPPIKMTTVDVQIVGP